MINWRRLFSGYSISDEDLMIFSEEFGTLINSGVPLIKSLDLLARHTTNRKLSQVLHSVRHEVEQGHPLSESLSKHPAVFSKFYVNLVKAGEMSGKFDEILRRLANYLDKRQALKETIKSAFTYPVIVCVISFFAVSFLLVYVVPVFYDVYQKMGLELPVVTLLLVKISKWAGAYWKYIILTVVISVLFFRRFSHHRVIKFFIDRLKLTVPLFGKLNRDIAITRFSRTLATLTSSGVPILKSMRLLSEIGENDVFNRIVAKLYRHIRDGEPIATSMSQYSIFPPVYVQMIFTAEETGKMDELLVKIASFTERNVDHSVKRLVTLLEPLMTLLMGGMVFFIALAIYLPMFDLVKIAHH